MEKINLEFSILINVKIDPELKQAIRKQAYENELTNSRIIRDILRDHFELGEFIK